ncbi:MAG: transcription antitermination factor NusB [Pseudomonadota bacterium]
MDKPQTNKKPKAKTEAGTKTDAKAKPTTKRPGTTKGSRPPFKPRKSATAKATPRPSRRNEVAGLAARQLAASLIHAVQVDGKSFDERWAHAMRNAETSQPAQASAAQRAPATAPDRKALLDPNRRVARSAAGGAGPSSDGRGRNATIDARDRSSLTDARDRSSLSDARDRAMSRLMAATALRRGGQIDAVLNAFLSSPLPEDRGKAWAILQVAAVQMLFLDTAPHAAINIAVEQMRRDPQARRFAKLANAVLRKVATEGPTLIAAQAPQALNTPAWMYERWRDAYGDTAADAIARAHLGTAALDVSVRADPDHWAQTLQGTHLATGSIRLTPSGRIEQLEGFDEGAWWVQDAAAALPVKLFGDVRGQRIADLCAAPGGKTAQLAAAGAHVTAIDHTPARLALLQANLDRLGLQAQTIATDARTWTPDEPLDGVLLDAPCTATGTIRRHPDIPYLRRPEDVSKLATIQAALLEHAATLVRPGADLVYCVCSLEPEEGPDQVAHFLAGHDAFARVRVDAAAIGASPQWLRDDGAIRTLPHHSVPVLSDGPSVSEGLDGFYIAHLRRAS